MPTANAPHDNLQLPGPLPGTEVPDKAGGRCRVTNCKIGDVEFNLDPAGRSGDERRAAEARDRAAAEAAAAAPKKRKKMKRDAAVVGADLSDGAARESEPVERRAFFERRRTKIRPFDKREN